MAASAMRLMALEAALYPDSETGGMLLGYWQGQEVVISKASKPGPAAQRGSTWFRPDHGWDTEHIAKVYASSGRTITYLGDWHTHPGATPTPSRTDRKTMKAVRREQAARQTRPLMVIVGPDPDSPPTLWCLLRRRRPTAVPYRLFDA